MNFSPVGLRRARIKMLFSNALFKDHHRGPPSPIESPSHPGTGPNEPGEGGETELEVGARVKIGLE